MDQFILINKLRTRIKRFTPFDSTIKQAQEMMQIEYGCVYKSSSRPVMKGSRIETKEAARKEYKKLLEDGWKKTTIFHSYFRVNS